MAKTKTKPVKTNEWDSTYVLKLVLYLIVGMLWLRLELHNGSLEVPLPVGLVAGILFAAHEHFRIDRKVEYALLLIAAMIGFWVHIGLFVVF